MMKKAACVVLAWGLLSVSVGCGPSNRVVGDRLIKQEQYFGDLGVTGHLNEVTVLRGSDLVKLSVIGDANQVNIDEGVTLGKVEVWGSDNVISVPEHLVLRQSSVGNRTTILRRPHNMPVGARFAPAEKSKRPGVEAAEDTTRRPPPPEENADRGNAAPGARPAEQPRSAPPPQAPRANEPQPANPGTSGTGSSFTPPTDG